MEILMGWASIPRAIFIWIDCIAFSLVDNAYDLFLTMADQQVISDNAINSLINNIYVLVGIIAFFRLAVLLINSIINPDKLYDKKTGIGGILGRIVLMVGLLGFTPFIFKEMMSLQTQILQRNIIPKTIIASVGGTDIKNKDYVSDAGKTMQKIVIMALIHPDEEYFKAGEAGVTQYLNNGTLADDSTNGPGAVAPFVTDECNKTCKKAMAQYHQMIWQSSKGGFKLRRLAGYIGGSREITTKETGTTEDVYYYEYIALLTTATAIFLTYIILSFTIDVAVRSVELAVLRILSPLFIATIIDPKSSDKYFKPYLKRIGKTYADLFIKIAIISFMVLAVSLVQDMDFGDGSGPFVKIALLYAVLIFAKKAPKMLGEMLGLKGDGLGLKGLNIKNKLGEAALVGDKVKKGLNAAEGGIKGAVGGATGGFKNTKGGLAAKLSGALGGGIKGGSKGFQSGKNKGETKGLFKGGYKDASKVAKGTRRSIFDQAGDKLKVGKEKVSRGLNKMAADNGFSRQQIARANNYDELVAKVKKKYSAKKADEILNLMKEYNITEDAGYENATKTLKNFLDQKGPGDAKVISPEGNISSHGINFDDYADPSQAKLELYKEREKVLSSVDSELKRANDFEASGHSSEATQIRKDCNETLKAAKENGIFDEIKSEGIMAVNVPASDPTTGAGPSTDKGFVASLTKNIAGAEKGVEQAQKEIDTLNKINDDKKPAGDGK